MRRIIPITSKNGIDGKVCGKCDMWIPLDRFHKSKNNKGGRAYSCKSCTADYRKSYNKENTERYRQYYEDNIDRIKKWRKERYAKERDEVLKARKNMSQSEREKINQQRRERYPLHKDKHVDAARKRRTILNGLKDNFTEEQKQSVIERFGGCALTGDLDYQWDHAIPIITGHGVTSYGNMIPLNPFLNKSKKDRNIFEWFEANRQRFEIAQETFDELIQWLADINEVTVEDYRDYVYWCHENPHSLSDLLDDKKEV